MNLFGWGPRHFQVESMAAGLKIGDGYIQCSVGEVSGSGLTCAFPTSRIQESLMEMLDKAVSISIDNKLIDGTFTWYTIEESTYRIGIIIDHKDRSAWRKMINARCKGMMHTSTRPASV